jgi:RimJ/RimL family protein N-acetyltransferase
VGNVPSRRVAEALGAELEGVLKSRLLLPSGRHDAALYGLVPEALAEDLRP